MVYISFNADCKLDTEEQYYIRENFWDCVDVNAEVTIEPAKHGDNLFIVSARIRGDDWPEHEVFTKQELIEGAYITRKLFAQIISTAFWRYLYYSIHKAK